MAKQKFLPEVLDGFLIAIESVSEKMFGFGLIEIRSTSKKPEIRTKRPIIFASAKIILKNQASIADICCVFGGKTTSCFRNNIRVHEDMKRLDPEYRDQSREFFKRVRDHMKTQKKAN